MKKIFFITALIITGAINSFAQEKRALIIAIDTYTPPQDYKPSSTTGRIDFTDLDGCVNDARSIISIITSRFQFDPGQVDTLYNTAATREGILKEINELYNDSKAGDIAFLYYAGHGSQVNNSLSDESDKKDETMVPSDTWKAGVSDIRDKELAAIYNKFIDKGIKLTVIMDCCHSGSISRGTTDPKPDKSRFIAASNYDAKDASKPQTPEIRIEGTFLIMSAAQDNEFAQEQRDEHGQAHGAFTIAFTEALNQQGVNASALNLFTSIRAILKSNGKKQEPVIGGSSDRQAQTLFGLTKGAVPDKSLVAILSIKPDGKIELQGGFALGLYKQNELVKFKDKDTLVKLRIDTVLGINKSVASVVKGDIKNLKAGELVEVTNWVSDGAPVLKIYIPASKMSYEKVLELAKLSSILKQSDKIHWMNDLEMTDPWLTLFYNNDKCYYNIDGTGIKELNQVSLNTILDLCKKDSTLYFELPPSKELMDTIRGLIKTSLGNIILVDRPSDAHYVLYGTISQDGKPSYGFRRTQMSSRDSLESMPLQTRNFIQDGNSVKGNSLIADSLYEYALRLFKVRAWLQMQGPKKNKNDFPFHLELVNDATSKVVGKEGSRVGENITVYIAADAVVFDKTFNPATLSSKYVYVFTINKYGKMQLLFPIGADGNKHNKFPQMDGAKVNPKVEIVGYEVEEPVGTDNIFLLATDEPISTYAVLFNSDDVRGGGIRNATMNPLESILNIAPTTRDIKPKTPANWVLYKLPVVSRH